MDEQTSTVPEATAEISAITPDPVVADTPVVEPAQTESVQAVVEPTITTETLPIEALPEPLVEAVQAAVEPIPALEISQTEPPSEPLAAEPEAGTGPQEPLSFSKTEDRQENQVAQSAPNEPLAGSVPAAQTAQSREIEPFSPPVAPTVSVKTKMRELFTRAVEKLTNRKQKKLLRIMALFDKEVRITNDDVEKLLRVSDATATRYLAQLEKENRIVQNGKTGQGVTYSKR